MLPIGYSILCSWGIMKLSYYTDEELERIEWFRNAGPCLREEIIRTYEIIHRTSENEGIRESCERILEGIRREI